MEEKLRNSGSIKTVIFGDMNINLLNNTPNVINLINLLKNYNYLPLHFMITRPKSGSCIDHIYSNDDNCVTNIATIENKFSDHNFVSCNISVTYHQSFKSNDQKITNFRRVSSDSFFRSI